MDVMMPDMDGIEACENIRKDSSLAHTIITFLTARGEDYSQVAGFDAGADDFITKPIKPKVLVSKVKALLRRLKDDDENPQIVTVGNIVINREEYKIEKDGEENDTKINEEIIIFKYFIFPPRKLFLKIIMFINLEIREMSTNRVFY